MFDDRLLRVGIEIAGKMNYYEGLSIYVTGNKYSNKIVNEATIKIINLAKDKRNEILTETTPYKMQTYNQKIIIEAGRKSYGYTKVYEGNMYRATITQPPDIILTIKCLTGFSNASKISSITTGATATLKQIAEKIATQNSLKLDFEATDKNIANFSYIGSILHQIDALEKLGPISAYIDNDKLVVKDLNKPLVNKSITLNEHSGMVGIPQVDEMGVKVKVLFNPSILVGGQIIIDSKINPAANGKYVVYKLMFSLASRDTDFYYIIEANRLL